MGLPSLFLIDDSVAKMEHITTKIKENQQDLSAFHNFSQPPTAEDIEGITHQIVWLLFQLVWDRDIHEAALQRSDRFAWGTIESVHHIDTIQGWLATFVDRALKVLTPSPNK